MVARAVPWQYSFQPAQGTNPQRPDRVVSPRGVPTTPSKANQQPREVWVCTPLSGQGSMARAGVCPRSQRCE